MCYHQRNIKYFMMGIDVLAIVQLISVKFIFNFYAHFK